MPSRSCNSSIRLTICACTETSSADTGSSATISDGDSANARAMPMRWRCPPENACGKRFRYCDGRCTSSSSSATRALRARAVGHAVHQQRLADDLGDRHARIERGERVLEDHLHLPPQRSQVLAREARHVDLGAALGAEADLAERRRDGAQDAARGGGLAAAALAHQRQRLAAIDGEAHVVHRAHLADGAAEQSAMDGIELAQIADVENAGHEQHAEGEVGEGAEVGAGGGRGERRHAGSAAPPPPPLAGGGGGEGAGVPQRPPPPNPLPQGEGE